MARAIGKLTAFAVTQAKRRGYYGDGGGLFLQVSASEAKSWVFCFKEAGKLREMGLGATYTVSLAEARQKALECRKARLDDLDPIDVRRGKRIQAKLDAAKAMTFAACAERYIASHKAGWRKPSTRRNGRRRSAPMSIPSSDLRRCKPRACRLALYILGCGVIGLVAVSLLTDYTKPGRLAEIRRRVGRLKLALRGRRCHASLPADSLVEEGGFEPSVPLRNVEPELGRWGSLEKRCPLTGGPRGSRP